MLCTFTTLISLGFLEMFMKLSLLPFPIMAGVAGVYVFGIGAFAGAMQCSQFPVPHRHKLAWILVSGLFPLLLITLALARAFDWQGPIQLRLSIGMLYGAITGSCLVWIVPCAFAEGEAKNGQRTRADSASSLGNESL